QDDAVERTRSRPVHPQARDGRAVRPFDGLDGCFETGVLAVEVVARALISDRRALDGAVGVEVEQVYRLVRLPNREGPEVAPRHEMLVLVGGHDVAPTRGWPRAEANASLRPAAD